MTEIAEQEEPEVDQVLNEIREASNHADARAAADRLPFVLTVLATSAPTQKTRDLLQRLLDERRVDGFFDSSNVSCRAAVLNAQLALGYPFALEISPEELQWLRKVTAQRNIRVYSARVVAMLAAL